MVVARRQRFLHLRLDVSLRVEPADDIELRVEEFHHARQPVGRGYDAQHHTHQSHHCGDRHVTPFQSRHEENHRSYRPQHHRRAQIWHYHQQDHQADRERRWRQSVASAIDGASSPGNEKCQEDYQRGFGEFRWLHPQRAFVQPAMIPGIERIHNDEQDQHHTNGAERDRGILEVTIVGPLQRHHGDHRHHRPHQLPRHHMEGGFKMGIELRAGLHRPDRRGDRRRAVENEQAESHHHQNGAKESPVGLELLCHNQSLPFNPCTICLKTSPRCSKLWN